MSAHFGKEPDDILDASMMHDSRADVRIGSNRRSYDAFYSRNINMLDDQPSLPSKPVALSPRKQKLEWPYWRIAGAKDR